ncbi:hypothetical protein [Chitiniphilus eburneus]|uniref:Uncharacterized protein n=1 Tax=Chitiniphilus eburneus TaxID=2571148 RepID=A0A4U0P8J7_9NEIS|nr:hypothetical protein [Chitiniphilus eburneus]TJZ63855.1 hypothetical protein FAZ21_19595 [Chitiniphilus eburneus]
MKQLFMMIFFGGSFLLTSSEIDVRPGVVVEVTPKKPLEAITSGAYVSIDVSKMLMREGDDLFSLRKKIEKTFPSQSVVIDLVAEDGSDVSFVFNGGSSISGDSASLILRPENETVPLSTKYKKILIRSSVLLAKVKIFWHNYSL